MMKLIQNIDVYDPQHLGKKDVLVINDKIVKIKDPVHIYHDRSHLFQDSQQLLLLQTS